MLKRIWPAIVLVVFLTSGIVAYIWESKPAAAVAILLAAIFLNGIIATIEDDLPGGFNNPDGLVTPTYARIVSWSIRAIAVIALVAVVVVMWLWKFG